MQRTRSGLVRILRLSTMGLVLPVLLGLAGAVAGEASPRTGGAQGSAATAKAAEPTPAVQVVGDAQDSVVTSSTAPAADSLTVTAYYFHRTFRCETCLHMEQVIHDLLSSRFSNDLSSGRIRWQPLDYEQEANAPLYAGYGLEGGPAFVLSRRVGQREVEWRELGGIWGSSAFPEMLDEYLAAQITLSLRPVTADDAGSGETDSTAAGTPESLTPADTR